jgi:hypothetical protein
VTYEDYYYQLKASIAFSNFIGVMSMLHLFIEICIFADLYFMLKNPFYPKESRMKLYYAFISFCGISYYFAYTFTPYSNKIYLWTTIVSIVLDIFFIFCSLARLNKQGIGKYLRKSIQKRFYASLFLLFVLLSIFVNHVFELVELPIVWTEQLEFSLFPVATLIKVSEPLIWKELKNIFREIKSKHRYEEDALFYFMNSALNFELVQVILQNICNTLHVP